MSFLKRLFNNKVMTWQEFIRYFADEIQNRLSVSAEVTIGNSINNSFISVEFPNGFKTTTFASNYYAAYCQTSEDLDSIISKAVSKLAETTLEKIQTESWQKHIFPVIKNLDWVSTTNRQMQQSGLKEEITDLLFITPLSGDLVLTYCVDDRESMRFLNRSEANEAGMDEDAVHQQAEQNFLLYAADKVSFQQSAEHSLAIFNLDGTYESTLALYLDNLIPHSNLPKAEGYIFCVPAWDVLLVCVSDDQAALTQMRELAVQIESGGTYLISSLLYTLKDGHIVLFQSH